LCTYLPKNIYNFLCGRGGYDTATENVNVNEVSEEEIPLVLIIEFMEKNLLVHGCLEFAKKTKMVLSRKHILL